MAEALAHHDHGYEPEHGHAHDSCGHNHALARRLSEAQAQARRHEGSRVRRALAVVALGTARLAVSSFCPLDDIVPLAMQVIKPADASFEQDRLAVLPRGSDPLETGMARLRAHSYYFPLDGPEPLPPDAAAWKLALLPEISSAAIKQVVAPSDILIFDVARNDAK